MDVVAVETACRGFLSVTESHHQHLRRPRTNEVGRIREEVGPEFSNLAPTTPEEALGHSTHPPVQRRPNGRRGRPAPASIARHRADVAPTEEATASEILVSLMRSSENSATIVLGELAGLPGSHLWRQRGEGGGGKGAIGGLGFGRHPCGPGAERRGAEPLQPSLFSVHAYRVLMFTYDYDDVSFVSKKTHGIACMKSKSWCVRITLK
jgi:hypothetical protein